MGSSNKMNKYKMLKELDDGAMATVHLAKNVKKDEKVLIKIMKKKYYSTEECKNNKEVQVRQKLQHDNVQKMVEMINDANELLLVLEHTPDNLQHALKTRDGGFSEKETKGIMLQVFHGLSYLHKNGIVHRYLRPEAILCNEDVSEVKIGDFSMARSLLDQMADYTVQPIWYTAPEVLLESLTYSTPIDIWAAGCIMAELFTGKPLLQGTDVSDQMKKICFLIGTLTKSEWQDGSQLMRQQVFTLPKVEHGTGLGAAGVQATPEAKRLIMELLVWNPAKRKTADQAVRDDLFKSDGDFVNNTEKQEILLDTEERLRGWKSKYEADLTRGSLSEFEKILASIAAGKSQTTNMRTSTEFPGFENNNPLLGDLTPRGKWQTSQPTRVGGKGGSDDPFGQFRSQKFQTGSQPMSNVGTVGKHDSNMPFESELQSREENKRSRQSGQEARGLFGDSDNSQQKTLDPNVKAEKLKKDNPMKYRARYGDDFMRSLLGDKPAQARPVESTQQGSLDSREAPARSSPQSGHQLVSGQDRIDGGVGMTTPHNGSYDPPTTEQQQINSMPAKVDARGQQTNVGSVVPDKGPSQGGMPVQAKRPLRRRGTGDDEYFASIDHDARAESLKQQNYLKFRAKYGDEDMRHMLGGRTGAQCKPTEQNSSYTPSWAATSQQVM